MSIPASDYFRQHNLFDLDNLRAHCEEQHVKVITSERFPDMVMLHYDRECQNKKLWSQFSRMCRGLIVNLQKKEITAHPFDKFYNLEEMPETAYSAVTNLGPFEVVEKIDGSMIILFEDTKGKRHLTTKGSFDSDHAKHAEELFPLDKIPQEALDRYTLVYELISYKFPVVINYALKGYSEGLYLIGARDKLSNKVLSYADTRLLARKYGFMTMKFFKFDTIDHVIDNAKNLPVLEEGFVMHFPETGLRVKIKGTEYLRAHRVVFNLTDKHIFEYLIRGDQSTLMDSLPEEYKHDIVKKIDGWTHSRDGLSRVCKQYFEEAPKQSKKDFALWVKSNTPAALHSFLFKMFSCQEVDENTLFKIVAQQENINL